MERIQRKKIIIVGVYLILFIFLILSLYLLLKPKETCTDGVKNQNEVGIDCGGICLKECQKISAQKLIIGKTGIVPSGIVGKYDFYSQITNPNSVFGSKKFVYQIKLKNAQGKIVAQREGSNFILPGEKKYIIESSFTPSQKPVSAEIKIKNSDWMQFNKYYERPDIKIINKNYNEISNGVGFAEAKGLLKNDSPYDFNQIKIDVILKNNQGNVVALNSTVMNTVNSREERDFRVFWPIRFSGVVGNMETQAEVNVFNSGSFLKKSYQSHKFQQY